MHEHGIALHLLRSLIFILTYFIVLTVEVLHIFVKCIPKYFMFFDTIVN